MKKYHLFDSADELETGFFGYIGSYETVEEAKAAHADRTAKDVNGSDWPNHPISLVETLEDGSLHETEKFDWPTDAPGNLEWRSSPLK